ncbi:MAG: MerR family transcriptional regulator [Candidatus Omnitrophica bacterium]|nr:MerR family transcriptional regulator [Candidatus Omnitrophota bacterium]
MKIYKISQVAQKLGISKQTLVRYEKRGILPKSPRNHINSWRQYSEEDVRRMKLILRKGFTLIELVMVMVIIAILAAVAIPRFDSFYSIKLSGAMKKAMSDIRYVQQVAVSRHTNTRVTFNKTSDIYTAEEEFPVGNNAWISIKSPFTRGDLTVNYATDPQYKGINITDANFNSSNILQFKWQGEPASGGRVDFEYKQNTNSILVQNMTGIVRGQ